MFHSIVYGGIVTMAIDVPFCRNSTCAIVRLVAGTADALSVTVAGATKVAPFAGAVIDTVVEALTVGVTVTLALEGPVPRPLIAATEHVYATPGSRPVTATLVAGTVAVADRVVWPAAVQVPT